MQLAARGTRRRQCAGRYWEICKALAVGQSDNSGRSQSATFGGLVGRTASERNCRDDERDIELDEGRRCSHATSRVDEVAAAVAVWQRQEGRPGCPERRTAKLRSHAIGAGLARISWSGRCCRHGKASNRR